MARQTRFTIAGIPQHVIQRGNNREPCFYEEGDYLRYKNDLLDAAKENQAIIHAYVLMTNHVHLWSYGLDHHNMELRARTTIT